MNARTGVTLRPDFEAHDRRNREAGLLSLTRAAIVACRGVRRRGLASPWRDDDADLILRSPVPPLTISDSQAFVRIAIAFLSALQPISAAAAVLSRTVQVDLAGVGAASVPSLKWPPLSFVGEGQPAPSVVGSTTAGPMLEPFKLLSLQSFSNELLHSTNAETLVRTSLLENAAASLDVLLFSDDPAVPEERPAGLLHGIAPLAASTGPDPLLDDLQAMATAVGAVAQGGILLVTSLADAIALSMRFLHEAITVLPSAALAPGTVIMVAPNGIASAVGAPTLEAGVEAAIVHEEDATPMPIVGGGTATPVRSYFQTDSSSLKLRLPCSWVLRDVRAIAWIEGASWKAQAKSPPPSTELESEPEDEHEDEPRHEPRRESRHRQHRIRNA
jgi:hypothetical protein